VHGLMSEGLTPTNLLGVASQPCPIETFLGYAR
jgi:hypothetical protein